MALGLAAMPIDLLENKPGTVAQAPEALGNAGINIEGIN
jgi:hypothetical protein